MSSVPDDLRYTKSHEWVRREEDGTVTVGITDHAQEQLGDIVFFGPPDEGASLSAEQEMGVVESVKAASDIYCPVTGEVVEVNTQAVDSPEIVNTDPYGDGWLVRLRPTDADDVNELLDADAYAEVAESGDH